MEHINRIKPLLKPQPAAPAPDVPAHIVHEIAPGKDLHAVTFELVLQMCGGQAQFDIGRNVGSQYFMLVHNMNKLSSATGGNFVQLLEAYQHGAKNGQIVLDNPLLFERCKSAMDNLVEAMNQFALAVQKHSEGGVK